MNKENGGPAFPVVIPLDQSSESFTGMTLRDYFAAKVMQGLLDAEMGKSAIAKVAYEMADAMLKAREQ